MVTRKPFWLRRKTLLDQVKNKVTADGQYQPDQLRHVRPLDWMVFEMKVEINEIEIKCKIELEERGNRMLWDESDDDEDEEEFGFIGKFIHQFFKKFLT